MRAKTISTISRRRRSARRLRALALGLGISALAIPASAVAQSNDGGYPSPNAIAAGSSQPTGGSDPSSVNSMVPPASEPRGSAGSLAAERATDTALRRDGSRAEPFVADLASTQTTSGDGFDWGSALVGAGAVLTLAAFGGAALLTVRRRTPIAPSAPTS